MSEKGQEYIIDYKELESGTYEIDYHIDKTFFEMFEESMVSDGNVDVHVQLKVSIAALQFRFDISGTLNVECDRCLERFDIPVEGSYDMVVKLGDKNTPPDEADDFIELNIDEDTIDIRQHIYEYVILSLPARKVHPDNEDGTSGCNPEMLNKFVTITDEDDYDDTSFYDDEEGDFDGEEEQQEEMETIEEKLSKNSNWDKLKELLNKV